MGDVAQVTGKVQQYLGANFTGVTLEQRGGFSLRHGSSRVFVEIRSPQVDGPTLVQLTVPMLFGVNDGPALHEHVAFHADDYFFGHLSLARTPEGAVNVFFTHTLLGDYLDEAELERAIGGVLGTADRLDDELQAQFGGERFHES